jgi:hypothetical protein
MSWLLGVLSEDSKLKEERNFAYASFAFAAVTGFCIGGTALANVIGIPYINKRLSLTNAVSEMILVRKVLKTLCIAFDICVL